MRKDYVITYFSSFNAFTDVESGAEPLKLLKLCLKLLFRHRIRGTVKVLSKILYNILSFTESNKRWITTLNNDLTVCWKLTVQSKNNGNISVNIRNCNWPWIHLQCFRLCYVPLHNKIILINVIVDRTRSCSEMGKERVQWALKPANKVKSQRNLLKK